jgi:hypothetical protein
MSLAVVQHKEGGRLSTFHESWNDLCPDVGQSSRLYRKAGLLKPGHHLRTLLALGLTRREGGPGTIGPPLTGHCHGGWRIAGRFVEGRLIAEPLAPL